MRNFNINLEKMIGLRGVSLVLVGTILLGGLSACAKKVDCNVEGNHAHLYTNEEGMEMYVSKELETYEGFQRQDDYVMLNDEEVNLYKFLDKMDLVSLEDNLDFLLAQQELNKDYTEYRYSYKQRVPMIVGKITTYRIMTRYDWTSDPNHSDLTGETRECHYVYQGFNVCICMDDSGKYVVVPSEEVDDINELVGSYDYVKVNFYNIVSRDNEIEIDYEEEQEASYDGVQQNAVTTSVENKPKVLAKVYK